MLNEKKLLFPNILVLYNMNMVCYNFGENQETIFNGIFWREKNGDYRITHTHNYWEFIICKQGPFIHTVNGKEQSLEKGDAVLLAPGDSHYLRSNSSNVVHINIGISEELFKEKCSSFSLSLYNFFCSNHPFKIKFSLERLKKIETYLKSILLSSNESEIEIIVSFVLFNIFEPIYTNIQQAAMPEWFKDLLIQCNSFEHLDWKPHDVCKYVSYSQAHINRVFRKTLNTSLVDYLINIKMDNAVILLTTSDMSLSDITSILGYSSISYFSYKFKEFYGVPPYKYRLQHLNQNENTKGD